MTHTNNPTEQQATPTSEEELRERLRKDAHFALVTNYQGNYAKMADEFSYDAMQLFTKELEKAKLEELTSHGNQWRAYQDDDDETVKISDVIAWYDKRIEELSKLQEEQK